MNKGTESFEIQSECIRVEGGDVGRLAPRFGTGTGAASVNVGMPSPNTGVLGVDDGGYQVVTRGRGKKGNNGKASATVGKSIDFHFEQPVEASKKRRVEEQIGDATRGASVSEQIQGLKNLIVRLIDQNEEREEEARKQVREIQALRQEMEDMKKLLQQNNSGKATYAATLIAGKQNVQATDNRRSPKQDSPDQSQRMRVEDDKCAITINTSRFKGEKTDFVMVKAALQQGIDTIATLQGIKIRCLRQLPGERINVVFATEAEAKKSKEQSGWLNVAMPEASVKSEAWYPVKCDMVSKQAVLDATVEGGRSLRKEVCTEFAVDNQTDNIDFTAMKASWLSKMDPWKKTGSLVVWLKNKVAADHLLKTGQALFGGGAYGAFCSRYEPSTADKICFNCNAYGHLQGACRRATRCGKCTGAHQTRDCRSQDPPKCAVCAGGHRSSDWACKRHPYHRRYLAAEAKQPRTRQPATTMTDVEMENPVSSQ
jgi:hypothetical protein